MYVYLASKASDGLPDWIDQKPELGSTMLQDLIGIRVILETFVRVLGRVGGIILSTAFTSLCLTQDIFLPQKLS